MLAQVRRDELAMLRLIRVMSHKEFVKLSVNTVEVALILSARLNGASGVQGMQLSKLILSRGRMRGEKLLMNGSLRGLPAEAILLPLEHCIQGSHRWSPLRWVTVEEHAKYDVVEKEGEVVLVKVNGN